MENAAVSTENAAKKAKQLLLPVEQLAEYDKLGCSLTQEEKIDSVEKSLVLWTYELKDTMRDKMISMLITMARNTEVGFAFSNARVRVLVCETLEKIAIGYWLLAIGRKSKNKGKRQNQRRWMPR